MVQNSRILIMRRLKKVYSIFIYMNPPNYRKNTINQYSIQEEFNIKMTQELEREVSEMCNLSEGVEQKGIAKGIAKGITASIRNLMESMEYRTGDGCTSDTDGREKCLSEYVEEIRK